MEPDKSSMDSNYSLRNLKRQCIILVGKLIRTKSPEPEIEIETTRKLKKCLTTLDLTSLGVGSCVGTGMYLVTGMVAHKYAGPGVAISFLIAAIASLLSGVCYAEFGVRVPHTTGSAYMYSYVTVGEFIAFIIGWNMILEYLIGTAAGACAISACLNALADKSVTTATASIFGRIGGHSPDLLSALITLAMTGILVAGVKKSLLVNNILNLINFSSWAIIMVVSLYYLSFTNWSQHGGFLPNGWSGVLSGAATCFYAFIGFDIIATTGEEAENPKWSIPTAIISSLLIALTAYTTSSLVLTLMVPWEQINVDSALVEMFNSVEAYHWKDLVAIGALAGLTVSMLGSMFPMPRVVYAMAKDGLIFRRFSSVWQPTGTPMIATVFFGICTAFASLLISLEVLVEMMSIGTLMAYTLVSTCVLLLRYQPNRANLVDLLPETIRSACHTPSREPFQGLSAQGPIMSTTPSFTPYVTREEKRVHTKRTNRYDSSESDDTDPNCFRQESKDDEFLVPGTAGYHYGSVPYQHGGSSGKRSNILEYYEKFCMYLFPYGWKVNGPATDETGLLVIKLVGLLYIVTIVFDVILAWFIDSLDSGNHLILGLFISSFMAIVACIFAIARQPQIRCDLKFKAPGVPFVPALAIVINIYLIFRLSILTLVRFSIWMTIGFIMYFGYGIKNSSLEKDPYPQEDVGNNSMVNMNQTNGNDLNCVGNQQIELTIPKDRLKVATNYQPSIQQSINKSHKTKLNGGSDIPKSKWQTFD
ncbi:probable cationic amino acid transporter [Panonychus citri]|uniref:probable cationic amino acid transporter n=1 Tax=Panonychus citri TaxID=50023 RepID=UPI00230745C0|nr:probable cationic amino acid transporter [Panonychus citri]XP_053211839.1 probable cationic amino acid transporter [Panonychus citri]XP_053211840.1 probable cationic amino acid transporter [Panonychus citri]